jgi:hypothetical protein
MSIPKHDLLVLMHKHVHHWPGLCSDINFTAAALLTSSLRQTPALDIMLHERQNAN